MPYSLKTGVAFCLVDGQYVFLDESADRYFSLADELANAFTDLIATGQCIASSRDRLVATGLLEESPEGSRPEPTHGNQVVSASPAMVSGHCRAIDVVDALLSQRLALARTKKISFSSCLNRVRRAKALRAHARQPGEWELERCIRGFELAKLFMPHANRCLPRSVALAERLSRKGAHVDLVLGVTSAPFAAHAWVQTGSVVLNDSPEEVRKYTAILRV